MTDSATPTSPRLLTVPEFAERLHISRASAYRLIAAGDVATVRLGGSVRITEQAITDLIRAKTNPARRGGGRGTR